MQVVYNPSKRLLPDRDYNKIKKLLYTRKSLQDLKNLSPNKNVNQFDALSFLYQSEDLVCIGEDVYLPKILKLSEYSQNKKMFESAQFIVPSPMVGYLGLTKENKISTRCLSNTGVRKWIVIECDFKQEDLDRFGESSTFDLCASVLLKLSEYRKLLLVVSSGSKSLHGWFPVANGEPEEPVNSNLWRFMAYATEIGGDRATWTKSQWVRMPGGLRKFPLKKGSLETKKEPVRQEIIYFDNVFNTDYDTNLKQINIEDINIENIESKAKQLMISEGINYSELFRS